MLCSKNPIGFKEARVSLVVFQAALCQRCTWELYQNNVQASCHDPGDWNVSLGKPLRHCHGTGHGTAVSAVGSRLSLPLSPASDRSCPQSPKKSSTPIAVMHSALVPLFSHLLFTENVLALDGDCTYQGLDPAVLGLGRQHRFMAQTTWSTPCSAKGGGLLTPQTSH